MRYQVERPVAPSTFETNQSPCFVRTRRPDFRPADDSRLLWVGRSWASLAASSEGDPAKAHELLHAMRESFVAKGFGLVAQMWAHRARDELSRIGLRRPTATTGLTAAQRRVAELVATGMSNREIANALYMSQRTVEAHLTRIYRELSIRSRSQLATALAASMPTTDGQPETANGSSPPA